MDTKKLESLIGNIKEKAGDEISSLIADDLGLLISENEVTNQEIISKDNQIKELIGAKENLITTNGNLLKQISMDMSKNPFIPEKEVVKNEFNIYDAFDNKGNFK